MSRKSKNGNFFKKDKKYGGNQKNKEQKKNRKRLIAVISLTIIIGLAIFSILITNNNKLDLVIENESITPNEFIQVMNDKKYEVTKYFFKEYGANVNKDFWTSEYDGESPYKMLADNTIETLLHNHSNYIIAKEHGYLTDIGYDNLMKRFELENKDRADKIANNEPVYGLAEFPFDLFIQYEMDSLQKMYINDIDNEGMDLSKKEGISYYDENKNSLFVKYDDIELEYINIYYDLLELEDDEVRKLENDLSNIYKEMSEEETLEDIVLNDYEHLQQYFNYEDISSEEITAKAKMIGDIIDLAYDLQKGESTQVINQNGSLYLIRVIDRVEYGYLPYEEVRDIIFKTLREKKFDEIVENKIQELTVTVDMKQVYSFTKKQF